jgi:hypothetical protein
MPLVDKKRARRGTEVPATTTIECGAARAVPAWLLVVAGLAVGGACATVLALAMSGRDKAADTWASVLSMPCRGIAAGALFCSAWLALPRPAAFSSDATKRLVGKVVALALAFAALWIAASPPPDASVRRGATQCFAITACFVAVTLLSRPRPKENADAPAPGAASDAAFVAWRTVVRRRERYAFLAAVVVFALLWLPPLRDWVADFGVAWIPRGGIQDVPSQFLEQAGGFLLALISSQRIELRSPRAWRFARSSVLSDAERRAWVRLAIGTECALATVAVLYAATYTVLHARIELLTERARPLVLALKTALADRSRDPPKSLAELVTPLPLGFAPDAEPHAAYREESDGTHRAETLGGFQWLVAETTWNGERRRFWLLYAAGADGNLRCDDGAHPLPTRVVDRSIRWSVSIDNEWWEYVSTER